MKVGDENYLLKISDMPFTWLFLVKAKIKHISTDYVRYEVEEVVSWINRPITVGTDISDTYLVQDWPADSNIKLINRQTISLIFELI